jgi:hypothetical protein
VVWFLNIILLSKPRRTAVSYDLVHLFFRMSGGGRFSERLHDSVYAVRVKLMSLELSLYHGDLAVCHTVGSEPVLLVGGGKRTGQREYVFVICCG